MFPYVLAALAVLALIGIGTMVSLMFGPRAQFAGFLMLAVAGFGLFRAFAGF